MEGDSRLNCRGRGGGRGQSSLSCSCNIYSSAQERLRPRHLYQKFYQVIREVLISHTLVLFSLEDMKNSHTLTQESRFLPGSSSEVEITIQPRYYFIMYFVFFFYLSLWILSIKDITFMTKSSTQILSEFLIYIIQTREITNLFH